MFKCGEFSFSYLSSIYDITEEVTDEELTTVILYQKAKPFNRIEFNIYRYKPEMVATILPSEMEGELNLDVEQVSARASAGLNVTEQSGLLPTGRPGRTYEACNIMYVQDENAVEALLTVTSTQIAHYNIITLSWADSEEALGSYNEVFTSFKVD